MFVTDGADLPGHSSSHKALSCLSSPSNHLHPSVLHITSPLWNAMGNSWGNCPLKINDQVERSGFSYCFFFPVSMVTAALRDFPQETKPKRKERIEKEKGQRRLRKKLGRCQGVRYFLLRGQSLVRFSASRVLILRSQGVNTNLYTVCVIVFHSFSTLLCGVFSAGKVGFSCPARHIQRQGGFQ